MEKGRPAPLGRLGPKPLGLLLIQGSMATVRQMLYGTN